MGKIAVVLFNLGGPDSREAIRPFLKNFFMDPAIIALPYPLRALVASTIARRRSKNEAARAYAALDYRSPLLANTAAQAQALEEKLQTDSPETDWKVFIAMRYWPPRSDAVARQVKAWGAEKIILLPLYPQFSTTTTGSSKKDWDRAARQTGLRAPSALLCCWAQDSGFVTASAANIKTAYAGQAAAYPGKAPRLLFSAHGLPEKIITGGDPYQWQCEESAQAIAAATNIPELDWKICYQSRVGRLKWIGPSTIEALEQAAADNVPVLIYPHAFVSEHVETIVEIGQDYRALAARLGVPGFVKVETLGTTPAFIAGLARMVCEAKARSGIISPLLGACSQSRFGQCCCRRENP